MVLARKAMTIYPTAFGCAGVLPQLRSNCLHDCHEILLIPILTTGEFLSE